MLQLVAHGNDERLQRFNEKIIAYNNLVGKKSSFNKRTEIALLEEIYCSAKLLKSRALSEQFKAENQSDALASILDWGTWSGCDCLLMSAPTGTLDLSQLSKTAPTLIKQADKYYLYGNSDSSNWALRELDADLPSLKTIDFPVAGNRPTELSCNYKFRDLYQNMSLNGTELFLMSVPAESTLPESLEKKPILLQQGDKYFIYGTSNGTDWNFHPLRSSSYAYYLLDFTSGNKLPLSHKYKAIYEEIALKKAHILTKSHVKQSGQNDLVNEFRRLTLSTKLELPTDHAFSSQTGDNAFMRFLKKWSYRLFGNFRVSNSDIEKIDLDLDQYSIIKDADPKRASNYFYRLQKIKAHIIESLNFIELNKSELNQLRSRLYRVNGYINETKKNQFTSEKNQSVAADVQNALLHADGQKKAAITTTFMKKPNQSMEAYSSIFNDLFGTVEYNIEYIGGGNFQNWRVTKNNSETFILRVEAQPENQDVVYDIRNTSINEFLLVDYASASTSSGETVYISEYASGGDLRAYRQTHFKKEELSNIIEQASSDAKQMIDFCMTSLENNFMYSDIKLTNFLRNADGYVCIADKKSFKRMEEKDILIKDAFTEEYKPPELREGVKINAEKYMSYQVGLALYDALVLPDMTPDKEDKIWSNRPLDFDKPIFTVEKLGQALQKLIESMTLSNPEKRQGLAESLRQLECIHAVSNDSSVNMFLQLGGKKPLPPIKEQEEIKTIKVDSVEIKKTMELSDDQTEKSTHVRPSLS